MEILNPQLRRAEKLSAEQIEALERLGSPLVSTLAGWLNKQLTCAHCKRCARNCEVLSDADLDIGLVEQDFQRLQQFDSSTEDDADAAIDTNADTRAATGADDSVAFAAKAAAVRQLVADNPALYNALRRCCFCGFCTSECATHMIAPLRMREWRELFVLAGLMDPAESKIVMVDNEWHIFSAYRAIYGIDYSEFPQLADLAASADADNIDTVFFPGCSLVSYAPELVRAVGGWLTAAGYNWALSQECCGSPLLSAGLFERSLALRNKLLAQMRAAGVKRVITVCPGCGEELLEVIGDEIEIVPLPELLTGGYDNTRNLVGEHSSPLHKTATRELPLDCPDAPLSVTFFDSCHDRTDTRHGSSIRALLAKVLPQTQQFEMEHHGKNTLCCGAGGAVATYDPDITQRRVWRIIDEARDTGAETLVTVCPTCTYTVAQARLSAPKERSIPSAHYLELVFAQPIDWSEVFNRLESMWTGEYGAWLAQTFY